MLRTIFLGNSPFCMPTLEVLDKNSTLCAIVTGPDRVVTQRKKITLEPAPKIYAKNRQIPYYQPLKMKDPEFLKVIKEYKPDLMVVISYGKILPPEVFEIPPLGTFNLHASLLPLYRGASPIQEALLHNDSKTGITLQKINEGMDDGDMYIITERPISPKMKFPELYELLSNDAALTLERFFHIIEKDGKAPPAKKQEGDISFCKKITKEEGIISFCKDSAQDIFNKFRAYFSWPQISFSFRGFLVKIEELEILSEDKILANPGYVLKADREALEVQTTKGILSLKILTVSGKKASDYFSFINGYKIEKGSLLC